MSRLPRFLFPGRGGATAYRTGVEELISATARGTGVLLAGMDIKGYYWLVFLLVDYFFVS